MVASDVDGERFAWREAGHGVPLVLLHGLGGSRLSWEPQLRALANGRRVVAWDLPGYGASAALDVDMTFTALADAVVAFIDVLVADAVHLAGISFGGMIAQYVAARYPSRVSSLTLLSTSPAFGLDGTKPQEWRATRLAPLDEETPVAYAFALADLIPHARLVVVPQAGHLLNVEAPDAVNQLLDDQVQRSSATAADR